MRGSFGRKLRECREEAKVSQVTLARALDVSTAYMSQVESGISGPMSRERIYEVAGVLHLDREGTAGLFEAAAQTSGEFKIPAGITQHHDRVLSLLSARLTDMTEDELARIELMLDGSSERPDDDTV